MEVLLVDGLFSLCPPAGAPAMAAGPTASVASMLAAPPAPFGPGFDPPALAAFADADMMAAAAAGEELLAFAPSADAMGRDARLAYMELAAEETADMAGAAAAAGSADAAAAASATILLTTSAGDDARLPFCCGCEPPVILAQASPMAFELLGC